MGRSIMPIGTGSGDSSHPLWRAEARIVIEDVYPIIDCGRFPAKRILGETVDVWADILRDGHDKIAAVVKHRPSGSAEWRETPMRHFDNDRWVGHFIPDPIGRHQYTIQAGTHPFQTRPHQAAHNPASRPASPPHPT